jgi:hypothetical protein
VIQVVGVDAMEAWSTIIKIMTKPRVQSIEATRCDMRFSAIRRVTSMTGWSAT